MVCGLWGAQIVQRLVAEVDAVSNAMLAGLLAKLGGPIQLPECLRVVGCLRRLAPFPEAELRTRCVHSLTANCRKRSLRQALQAECLITQA